MIVYAAPRGMEDYFPFHIQFYPLLRSPQKQKFLAGCELGAGSFLVDILPETAAQSLREVKVEDTP
jgi:UDPglucose--hexose-1-phosphate uridylyltransferase